MAYPGLNAFKCRAGILAQPNPQLKLSRTNFDELSMRFLLGTNWQSTLYVPGDPIEDNLGSQIDQTFVSSLYCDTVNISRTRGALYADVLFKGIISKKIPEGGGGIFLNEEGIDTHPNYQYRPDTWAEKDEELFGTGPSPNRYGRVTDADGAFLRFGKTDTIWCGQKRDDPKTWGCMMVGVESYLTVGQLSYDYSILSSKDWLEDIMDQIGQKGKLKSQLIPPPEINGDWLFNGYSREIIYVGDKKFYKTTVTFLGSGAGGWHPWIYKQKQGSAWDLDDLSGAL